MLSLRTSLQDLFCKLKGFSLRISGTCWSLRSSCFCGFASNLNLLSVCTEGPLDVKKLSLRSMALSLVQLFFQTVFVLCRILGFKFLRSMCGCWGTAPRRLPFGPPPRQCSKSGFGLRLIASLRKTSPTPAE